MNKCFWSRVKNDQSVGIFRRLQKSVKDYEDMWMMMGRSVAGLSFVYVCV